MATRVRLKSSGMEAMLKSAGIRAMLTKRAVKVLAAAQADEHDDSGAYEAGLHIEHATTDRAVVRVTSGDYKGHILEARYGILARALDAAGGD